MQSIERRKSESSNLACAFSSARRDRNANTGRFQPEESRQAAVLAGILLVFKIVSG